MGGQVVSLNNFLALHSTRNKRGQNCLKLLRFSKSNLAKRIPVEVQGEAREGLECIPSLCEAFLKETLVRRTQHWLVNMWLFEIKRNRR